MPKTIEQVRVEHAARVIAQHYPRLALVCLCGQAWTPLHVAQELAKAGALG